MVFIIGEGILIFVAVSLSSFYFFRADTGIIDLLEIIWPKVVLIAIVTQFSLYFSDLYEFKVTDSHIDLASRLIQSIGITSVLLAAVYFLWPDMIIGRWIFFSSLILLLFFLVSWRFLYAFGIRKKIFTEKAVLLGSGGLARDILDEINSRKDIPYNVDLVMMVDRNPHNNVKLEAIPISYGFDNVCDYVEAEDIRSVIVALDERRGVFPYRELLDCKMRGINIIDGESFYERITGKVLVEKINPSWLIFSEGFAKSKISRIMKRLLGMLMSTVLLIGFSPLILLVAVAIKLDSRGSVFFSQERVGKYGKVFMMHKFRSMDADAEEASGPVWADESDSRITRVGNIIRRLRVDEIPQLWNVLKGDMSFVGPRPERPFFVEKLKKIIPYYNERLSVKPGLTGWAQIKFAYSSTEEEALEKLKYDLYYIKNMSLVMDLIIIFHTIKIVLLGRGSR
jgi:sugar transferase (PEP-CTERM system associated)